MATKKVVYMVTPKGILCTTVSEEGAERILNGLELYMRRNDFNALTFAKGTWEFVKIWEDKCPEKKKS